MSFSGRCSKTSYVENPQMVEEVKIFHFSLFKVDNDWNTNQSVSLHDPVIVFLLRLQNDSHFSSVEILREILLR